MQHQWQLLDNEVAPTCSLIKGGSIAGRQQIDAGTTSGSLLQLDGDRARPLTR